MNKIFLNAYLFFAITTTATAQAPSTGVSALNDQFSDAATLEQWKRLDQAEGWPNKFNRLSIENGQLVIEPGTSGWFADMNAPFIYKEIQGDFDVRARIRATGTSADISTTTWSLGGLMARVPKRTTKDQWKSKEETWLFINTGIAQETGKPVIESKYTINSKSSLKLREGKAAWINVRIVRVGNSFVSLYKYDGDKTWTVQDRYYIADLPNVMQVGFQCYTNSEAVSPAIRFNDPFTFNTTVYNQPEKEDMRLLVDFFEVRRPAVNFAGSNPMESWLNNVSKNNLTDYSLTNERVTEILGN